MGSVLAQETNKLRLLIVLALTLVCLLETGCVRRRFMVRTNPPGAVLYVDNQEIGVTPVATDYTYYGTREIRLEKDGFEPVVQLHRFSPPWYQYPPLDFITETLVPWEIRDERELDFEMVPLRIVPPEELRARAEQLRSNAQAGFATPIVPGEQMTVPAAVVPPAQRVPLWEGYGQPQPGQVQLGQPQPGQPTYEPAPPTQYLPSPGVQGPQSLPPGGYELPPLPQ